MRRSTTEHHGSKKYTLPWLAAWEARSLLSMDAAAAPRRRPRPPPRCYCSLHAAAIVHRRLFGEASLAVQATSRVRARDVFFLLFKKNRERDHASTSLFSRFSECGLFQRGREPGQGTGGVRMVRMRMRMMISSSASQQVFFFALGACLQEKKSVTRKKKKSHHKNSRAQRASERERSRAVSADFGAASAIHAFVSGSHRSRRNPSPSQPCCGRQKSCCVHSNGRSKRRTRLSMLDGAASSILMTHLFDRGGGERGKGRTSSDRRLGLLSYDRSATGSGSIGIFSHRLGVLRVPPLALERERGKERIEEMNRVYLAALRLARSLSLSLLFISNASPLAAPLIAWLDRDVARGPSRHSWAAFRGRLQLLLLCQSRVQVLSF